MRRLAPGAALLLGLLLLAVSVLALVPWGGAAGFVLSVLLPTLAPHLLLLALVGLVLARLGRRRRRVAVVGALACAMGAVAPAVALGGLIAAARSAGVHLDPVRALAPGSMAARPDLVAHYAPGASGAVEVYRPRDIPTGESAPVLFDVHGGGWNTDGRMEATLRWFANHGWLVVRPSYPLATSQRPTWDLAPAAVERAYAWTAAQAGRLGGDPSRMVVFGDSAGGGMAINLADRLARGLPATMASLPRPRAVAVVYPTVDVAAVAGVTRLGAGNAARQYIGGSPGEFPQRYRQVASGTWVSGQAPPTLVIQGTADSFVPPASVAAFVDRAREAGADARLVRLPLLNHAFDATARDSLGFQVVTRMSDAWLRDHAEP